MNETGTLRFFLLILALAGLLTACGTGESDEPPLAGSSIGGPFALVDQNGRAVTDRSYAGRYRIVYFGFANCPDICPTDLATIGQAMRRLEKEDAARAAKVQPIFISVDPERDTPARLKEYATAFHPRLAALTGTPQQVDAAANAFKIYYKKVPADNGEYQVDHMRVVYLMDPQGKPVALLPHDKGPEALAAEVQRWVT